MGVHRCTVIYMLFICLSFIYIVYSVSDDPNIDSQQVVYISLIFF